MGVLVNNVIGFSLFGLAVRVWQLGLVNRPLFKRNELWTHASYMVVFGALGYGVVHLEERISLRLQELRVLRGEARDKRAEKEAALFAKYGLPEDKKEAMKVWKEKLENLSRLREELLAASGKEVAALPEGPATVVAAAAFKQKLDTMSEDKREEALTEVRAKVAEKQ
ncbi:hypothetical protein CALCODRAFT_517327 [Calocera cornea HHB12733]|uniref:Uncharacterized protein n=1 Tax=Calocera cornea HHB12733 TaxID=1353952 RepID=A0A165G6Y5_9BASI|nr:hypothetical protein CALCODRAFT_517327 [Calocera cornea HHB12733]